MSQRSSLPASSPARRFSHAYVPSDENAADADALAHLYQAGVDVDTGVETLIRLTTEVPRSQACLHFRLHPHSLERIAHTKESAAVLRSGLHPLTKQALPMPLPKMTYAMTSWVDLNRVTEESCWIRQFDDEMRAFAEIRLREIDAAKRRLRLAEDQGDPFGVRATKKESEALMHRLQEEIAVKQREILLQTSQPFHRAIVQVTRGGLQSDPNARLTETLDRTHLPSSRQ